MVVGVSYSQCELFSLPAGLGILRASRCHHNFKLKGILTVSLVEISPTEKPDLKHNRPKILETEHKILQVDNLE